VAITKSDYGVVHSRVVPGIDYATRVSSAPLALRSMAHRFFPGVDPAYDLVCIRLVVPLGWNFATALNLLPAGQWTAAYSALPESALASLGGWSTASREVAGLPDSSTAGLWGLGRNFAGVAIMRIPTIYDQAAADASVVLAVATRLVDDFRFYAGPLWERQLSLTVLSVADLSRARAAFSVS